MKRFVWIGFLFLALLACHCSPESPGVPAAPLRPELVAIDTLMQSRPDSALAMLLAEPLDDPYYHLLLSEALYKNDSAQVNRPKLLAAMASFDSAAASPRSASQQAYLAARCHYMNGVGYYEMDSVVRACEQYMTALEIMEERFSEKDLVGPKAKFMALTYTHLTQLFSDQYLHEQAIFFGKRALSSFYKYNAEPSSLIWTFVEIGSCYDIMERLDSADLYYKKALLLLPDTNSLAYRDIETHRSYLLYRRGGDPTCVMKRLQEVLTLSKESNEYYSRCLSIGDVYYQEQQIDSAWIYLSKVFEGAQTTAAKKQAAEWLLEICKAQGKSPELYTDFLAPFANMAENTSLIKSQITDLNNSFSRKAVESRQQRIAQRNKKYTLMILSALVMVIVLIAILYHQRRTKLWALEGKIAEQQSRTQKRERLEQFLNEDVCQGIILSMNGKSIKRSAIPSNYPELILDEARIQKLALTVYRYFPFFDQQLEQHKIKANSNLVNLCYMYLLGMNEKQSAILLNRDYSSVKRYEKKLRALFNTQSDMVVFMRKTALKN